MAEPGFIARKMARIAKSKQMEAFASARAMRTLAHSFTDEQYEFLIDAIMGAPMSHGLITLANLVAEDDDRRDNFELRIATRYAELRDKRRN